MTNTFYLLQHVIHSFYSHFHSLQQIRSSNVIPSSPIAIENVRIDHLLEISKLSKQTKEKNDIIGKKTDILNQIGKRLGSK